MAFTRKSFGPLKFYHRKCVQLLKMQANLMRLTVLRNLPKMWDFQRCFVTNKTFQGWNLIGFVCVTSEYLDSTFEREEWSVSLKISYINEVTNFQSRENGASLHLTIIGCMDIVITFSSSSHVWIASYFCLGQLEPPVCMPSTFLASSWPFGSFLCSASFCRQPLTRHSHRQTRSPVQSSVKKQQLLKL